MKISDLEFFLVEIDRSDTSEPVRSLLVCLSTDSGEEGWGEAPMSFPLGQLRARRETIQSAVIGRSVFDVEEMVRLDALDEKPLRCALEMASWDLTARLLRQPLCHLMGGCYRRRIPLVARLPLAEADGCARFAREFAERGFHAQVVQATGDVAADGQRVAAVLEAAGEQSEIRFDGCGSFSVEQAAELCFRFEGGGVRYFLDPLASESPEGLDQFTELARQTSFPLGVSRSLRSARQVMAIDWTFANSGQS
jgi:L-alanine-DL-glutamate epimerase-like enolase superfamily enzyme